MKIVLDGSTITDKEKLHSILKSEFNFPDYYGNNLDALWDCLTGDIKLPVTLEWKNFDISKNLLGDYADKTLNILLKTSELLKGRFDVTVL
jgi:ribonuclease inhibitor